MTDDRPPMTPENLNFGVLPDQTMYKMTMDETDHWDLEKGGVSHPLIFTNEWHSFLFEADPGEGIDWHTHMPHIEQIILGLEGKVRYRQERGDGEYHDMIIGPGEVGFLPGGARHEVEVIGDEHHKEFVVYKADDPGRLELLEVDKAPYDIEDWPIALWVDRLRDEVVVKDDDVVTDI